MKQAEKKSGVEIDEVFLGVGGIGLSSITTQSQTMISRTDGEITKLDIERVIQESQAAIPTQVATNRKFIQFFQNVNEVLNDYAKFLMGRSSTRLSLA